VPASGLGLIGLRERIEALGGEFEIATVGAETPGAVSSSRFSPNHVATAGSETGTQPGKTRSDKSGRDQTGRAGKGTRVVAKIPIGPGTRSGRK
jgi:glucose-6-phosphate-specific signal transduction histidine kinase